MKYLFNVLFFYIVLCFNFEANAEERLFDYTSYSAAIKLANNPNQKPILLIYTASWCEYCRDMIEKTLLPLKKEGLLDNFILLNLEKDSDRKIEKKFGFRPVPHMILLTKDGQRITFQGAKGKFTGFLGYYEKDKFARLISAVVKRFKKDGIILPEPLQANDYNSDLQIKKLLNSKQADNTKCKDIE